MTFGTSCSSERCSERLNWIGRWCWCGCRRWSKICIYSTMSLLSLLLLFLGGRKSRNRWDHETQSYSSCDSKCSDCPCCNVVIQRSPLPVIPFFVQSALTSWRYYLLWTLRPSIMRSHDWLIDGWMDRKNTFRYGVQCTVKKILALTPPRRINLLDILLAKTIAFEKQEGRQRWKNSVVWVPKREVDLDKLLCCICWLIGDGWWDVDGSDWCGCWWLDGALGEWMRSIQTVWWLLAAPARFWLFSISLSHARKTHNQMNKNFNSITMISWYSSSSVCTFRTSLKYKNYCCY
jgi:hypothetical protein